MPQHNSDTSNNNKLDKQVKSLSELSKGTPFEIQSTIISEPEKDDLSKNSVDDSKANTLLNNVKQALHNNQETIFHIKNPYAIVEAIDEADYYKQNADIYLAEYQLIQQKQSKLSSTKRRKIVHIVETYLLT